MGQTNPDTSYWDTRKVYEFALMFQMNKAARPNVTNWDLSGVGPLGIWGMFMWTAATPDVSKWDVSRVTAMNNLILSQTFNSDGLNSWDTSSVTTFYQMFYGATAFNGDINGCEPTGMRTHTHCARANLCCTTTRYRLFARLSGFRSHGGDRERAECSEHE